MNDPAAWICACLTSPEGPPHELQVIEEGVLSYGYQRVTGTNCRIVELRLAPQHSHTSGLDVLVRSPQHDLGDSRQTSEALLELLKDTANYSENVSLPIRRYVIHIIDYCL